MNNTGQNEASYITSKYIALISIITRTEDRLRWSELVYLSLNILVFFFLISFVSSLTQKTGYLLTYMDIAMAFIYIVIGMSINAYWIAFAMRVQLRLKLRYFQARAMERKLDISGEHLFSDESIFFDPEIRQLQSADNKETLKYPSAGLTRMDGIIGAAKPRHFSWLIPCMFIFIYWLIFFLILTVM